MTYDSGRTNKDTEPVTSILLLSHLVEVNKAGAACVKVVDVSGPLKSRNGWAYRKMNVQDGSHSANLLVSEEKYVEWKFKKDDHIVGLMRSNGIGNDGRLTLFFNEFLGPFETAKLLFELNEKIYEITSKSGEHMKSSETVYQISAREAKSLLELIKLWMNEGKPQHYTKWCQMHQIVATNLYYMGLVKRTASMSGFYYPTDEALEFFEGKRDIPKKRVFVRDRDGKHVLASDQGDRKSFSDYLGDFADRESALREYREALAEYKTRIKAGTS
ncbi:MAG: hypothetical protein JRN20_12645 [Nitrososphaerota archaeon]|nr:hypothetical protein [Nitrososphaerota archaeon]